MEHLYEPIESPIGARPNEGTNRDVEAKGQGGLTPTRKGAEQAASLYYVYRV